MKVKFQHEVYPPCKPECESSLVEHPVSRQVFIVQDLEIRDRLATSQMNKFLYLYCSKEMPRKAHSNMVKFKTSYILLLYLFRESISIISKIYVNYTYYNCRRFGENYEIFILLLKSLLNMLLKVLFLKNYFVTSLVAQWLRLCLPTQGVCV